MRSWLFGVTIWVLGALSGTAWSIGNPGVGSPVGPGTVPPSSIEGGLFNSPNPIDTSGNLVITGNVRDGKHFRGTVPYGSITDLRTSVGTASLDSFLRDSASPEDFGRYVGGYSPYYAPEATVTGSYRPFYSPTTTVATTLPGSSGIFLPATTKIRGYAGSEGSGLPLDGFAARAGPEGQDLLGADGSDMGLKLWGPQLQVSALGEPRPMSRTPQEIERLISDELGGQLLHRDLTNLRVEGSKVGQYEDGINQFQRELTRMRDETTAPKQTPQAQDELASRERSFREADSLPTQVEEPSEGMKRLFGPPGLDSEAGGQEIAPMQPSVGGLDAYESAGGVPGTIKGTWQSVEEMRQQIYSLTTAQAQKDTSEVQQDDFEQSLGGRLPTFGRTSDVYGREKGPAEKGYQAEGLRSALEGLRTQSLTDEGGAWISAEQDVSSKKTSVLDGPGYGGSAEEALGTSGRISSAKLPQSTSSGAAGPQSAVDMSSDSDLASRARAILGEYKSVDAFWQAKFDQYVTAGETYLKEGRYYRAVDAFSLASVYKSDAPRAYAGRSLGLFAAGEYMSSALFLSRALEIYPEYAESKVYFAAMLRDKDKLSRRIADAEECLKLCREAGSQLSGEADLAFLLSYVYYQMGRLGEAKKAIDAAYEELPDSKAVMAVKKVIESAMAASQPAIK